ncbi:glucosaminidase domain-containing protein [Clostridium sp. ZS2-4]|uniref:glucosaminidase domain-containing protein n=1 Tax=Clostridium sp. ZS2-4 TaxID=2987703 RepID=UPI00227C2667|nr:glucosaminidase domain-containing protein [Clostridium sp. ZS2-4]MCY6356447.1 glucosaminidase domain-containing protein [Clostridium sp. ZS2-4]
MKRKLKRRKIEKRKIIKKMYKIIALLIIVGVVLNMANYFIWTNSHIDDKKLNISSYINAADEASKGKLQINWKYLVAIDGVRYKNDFSKTDNRSLKDLADMFVIKNSTTYKAENSDYRLRSIEEVLEQLSFKKEEKKRVYTYLDDLKYMGLVKKNLKENSPQRKFINKIAPDAVEIYKQYGIFPSITIAQAILETRWGKSELAVKANNLFGIKADKSWKGKCINMKTSEYYDKVINDGFRVYENASESLKDYGEFLSKNKRYKKYGVFSSSYYIEQAEAIENAGYSTKEDKKGEKIYADLLINLIRENNLQLIDSEVQMEYSKRAI